MLAAVTRSPGEMLIESVSVPGPARAGNVIVQSVPETSSANRASLAAIFSHHFPLARTADAFEFAMSRPQDAIKIVATVN